MGESNTLRAGHIPARARGSRSCATQKSYHRAHYALCVQCSCRKCLILLRSRIAGTKRSDRAACAACASPCSPRSAQPLIAVHVTVPGRSTSTPVPMIDAAQHPDVDGSPHDLWMRSKRDPASISGRCTLTSRSPWTKAEVTFTGNFGEGEREAIVRSALASPTDGGVRAVGDSRTGLGTARTPSRHRR